MGLLWRTGRYPCELRDDVVRVARDRDSGGTPTQVEPSGFHVYGSSCAIAMLFRNNGTSPTTITIPTGNRQPGLLTRWSGRTAGCGLDKLADTHRATPAGQGVDGSRTMCRTLAWLVSPISFP